MGGLRHNITVLLRQLQRHWHLITIWNKVIGRLPWGEGGGDPEELRNWLPDLEGAHMCAATHEQVLPGPLPVGVWGINGRFR